MSENVVRLIVDLNINEGKFEEFEALAKQMSAGSEKEPGTLGYEWFISVDRKSTRLVETYVDAAAVLEHFMGPVVQTLVPKVIQVASVGRFEVYGDPGAQMTARLGAFGAVVFKSWE
jgi:quinol monooxygenase YgiN